MFSRMNSLAPKPKVTLFDRKKNVHTQQSEDNTLK
jgi:hypothetical protein